MFQLHIFYYKHNEEGNIVVDVAINCSYCNKETGINFKNTTIEEMITNFVLTEIFHHVGMSWII